MWNNEIVRMMVKDEMIAMVAVCNGSKFVLVRVDAWWPSKQK